MKNSLKIIIYGLLFLTTSVWGDVFPNQPPDQYETQGKTSPMLTAASAESSHWLALIDQAQYGPSWLDAGPLFQDIITQEQWMAAMRVLRRPLGNVKARTLEGHQATETLPGGTKGYFMVIRYRTSFSQKPSATETVTLMMIQSEQWRVISYVVR